MSRNGSESSFSHSATGGDKSQTSHSAVLSSSKAPSKSKVKDIDEGIKFKTNSQIEQALSLFMANKYLTGVEN